MWAMFVSFDYYGKKTVSGFILLNLWLFSVILTRLSLPNKKKSSCSRLKRVEKQKT